MDKVKNSNFFKVLPVLCFFCLHPGHLQRNCERKRKGEPRIKTAKRIAREEARLRVFNAAKARADEETSRQSAQSSQISSLRTEMNPHMRQISDLNNQVDILKNENSEQKAKYDQEIAKLNDQVKVLQDENTELLNKNREIFKLNKQVGTLRQENSELKTRLSSANTDRDKFKTELSALKDKFNGVNSEKTVLKQNFDVVSAEMNALMDENSMISTKFQNEISSLKSEIEEKDAKLAKYSTKDLCRKDHNQESVSKSYSANKTREQLLDNLQNKSENWNRKLSYSLPI